MLKNVMSLSCRTCMKQNATINLYESVKIDESIELQLVQLLLECTTIQVAENDGLPQIICQECKNVLQMWFSFRQQAFKADHEFKKVVDTNLLKEEIKEESEDNYEQLTENTDNFECELKLEDTIFSCSKCRKTFSVEGEYHKHLNAHLNFSCSYCSEHFKKESSLLKHINRTHNEVECNIKTDPNETLTSIYSTLVENEDGVKEIQFKCQFCNTSFPKLPALKMHMKKNHKEMLTDYKKSNYFTFMCIYCKEQFKKESSLLKHISRVHNEMKLDIKTDLEAPLTDYSTITIENESGVEEIRYQCNFCETLYPKLKNLKIHMKRHKTDKPLFICDTCGKGFMSKQCLKRHVHLHLENVPFHCRVCSKPYKRKDQLKVHMLTHKADKPNVCPYCNKTFVQLCSLKDHIRIHTKETPYLCSECGKGFANSSNLRQHMMRHTGIKQHQCKLCPKTFCTKGQMTSHMSTHSGAHPYKCATCGARFTKSGSLKKHAAVHSGARPHACDTCLMRFSCKDHLKRHQRIHTGEKPYKCRYCGRAYTQSNDLVKHLRTHLGQNVYSCSVCGMGFRLQTELKLHYPTHYCTDNDAVTALLGGDSSQPAVPAQDVQTNIQTNIQTDIQPNMQTDKFMITINSMDGTNVVAINIEPDTLKVS